MRETNRHRKTERGRERERQTDRERQRERQTERDAGRKGSGGQPELSLSALEH